MLAALIRGMGLKNQRNGFENKGANAEAGLNPQNPHEDISIFPSSVDNGTYTKIQPGDLSFETGARLRGLGCLSWYLFRDRR